MFFTVILLEAKVISLCHQYRARPEAAHSCSLTRLYTVSWSTSSFHLGIPKNYCCFVSIYKSGRVRPVVAHSPADREVHGPNPILAQHEFLRAQEMNL